MKIETATLSVQRSSGLQEQGFSIAGNAKAFDILSSKIYTDVPLAIVRELSTNAYDSHVDAGCPEKPFDVHLPNYLEPWLTIRDYGTGLSPEDVQNVYTTYFKSTRSTSDDFTGCLGLGSKSPFAYTDQFTIIANWNGKQYTYSAFKNESDCPTLATLGEVETSEHNGLEIRIAIKPGDFNTFVEAAKRVYQYFKVKPNIVGATLKFDEQTPEMEGPGFILYKNPDSYSRSKSLKILMGQICYHANLNQMGIGHQLGNQADLVLEMPIGSCSISASREDIHYDKKTTENVLNAMLAAINTIKLEFESRVATEPYLLLKLLKISKYKCLITNLSVGGMALIPSTEEGAYTCKECTTRRGDKLFFNTYYRDFGQYDQEFSFVHEDVQMTQNLKNRLRQFMHSKNNTITSRDHRTFLVKIEKMDVFTERFGPPIALSSLPDVPKVAKPIQPRTPRAKPIKIMNIHYGRNMSMAWENTSTIDTTKACCVRRDGNWVIWNGNRMTPEQAAKIAIALGYDKIYGISTKRYASLRAKYNLPELETGAKDQFEQLVKRLDQYALSNFLYQNVQYFDENVFKKPEFNGLSQECDNFLKTIKADTSICRQYKDLGEFFDIKMPVAPNYKDIFFKKYPILLAIDWFGGNIQAKDIVQYIKLCN